MSAPGLVTFSAPCPQGHEGASWRSNPPHTAAVAQNDYAIRCRACDPPRAVTIANPVPHQFRPPWRAA